MQFIRFIALLGGATCATIYVWTFTKAWDVDQADRAAAFLSVGVFVVLIPAILRSQRLRLRPLSTSLPAPSLLLAAVPYLLLYGVLNSVVAAALLKGGGIYARDGSYFQFPWWGHATRDREWEISLASYRRLFGFQLRAILAVLLMFYVLAFAVLSLERTPSAAEGGAAGKNDGRGEE